MRKTNFLFLTPRVFTNGFLLCLQMTLVTNSFLFFLQYFCFTDFEARSTENPKEVKLHTYTSYIMKETEQIPETFWFWKTGAKRYVEISNTETVTHDQIPVDYFVKLCINWHSLRVQNIILCVSEQIKIVFLTQCK